jgi:hypothetical protein
MKCKCGQYDSRNHFINAPYMMRLKEASCMTYPKIAEAISPEVGPKINRKTVMNWCRDTGGGVPFSAYSYEMQFRMENLNDATREIAR